MKKWTRILAGLSVMMVCVGLWPLVAQAGQNDPFGTYRRPFSAKSLWNAKPVGVRLGNFQIPDSLYFPSVGESAYSTAAFLSNSTDPEVRVYGLSSQQGIRDLDAESMVPFVTIPHWPQGVIPAKGTDGHADIIDPDEGKIHSFLGLKQDSSGRWVAAMYAWSPLNGTGWGEPAHYYQGARATAVASTAGVIRRHEINDGEPMYAHALAMSLTHNALSATQGYVFPATSADTTWKENTGMIPEGALMMLPASFDVSSLSSPVLQKIARTLQVYGAYVVDRNVGTPFSIYVENRSGFNLHSGGWKAEIVEDLKKIQKGLRMVVDVDGWLDGYGQPFSPQKERFNLISMRGLWVRKDGLGQARFDSVTQSVVLTDVSRDSRFENYSNRNFSGVDWGKMEAGKRYRLKVEGSRGLRFFVRLINDKEHAVVLDSSSLDVGRSFDFVWPSAKVRSVLGILGDVGLDSARLQVTVMEVTD